MSQPDDSLTVERHDDASCEGCPTCDPAMREGWDVYCDSTGPDGEINSRITLGPEAWAKFCALVGMDPETGHALPDAEDV